MSTDQETLIGPLERPRAMIAFSVSRVVRHLKDERAQDARAFYEQALVFSDGSLWILADEPVWQLANARTKELARFDAGNPLSLDQQGVRDFQFGVHALVLLFGSTKITGTTGTETGNTPISVPVEVKRIGKPMPPSPPCLPSLRGTAEP